VKRTVLAVALVLGPALAIAFQITDDRWPTAAKNVHTGRLPPAFATAVAQAASAWRSATHFNLTTDTAVRGSCDVFNGPLLDGIELANVDCSGIGFGSRVLALTEWYTDGAGTKLEFGITFNSSERWAVYDGPLRFSEIDFRRVALHELGHVIGLEHESSQLAIMSATIGDRYTLLPDDVNGVVARYPELRRVRILAPTGGSDETDPLFQWQPVSGATRYGFRLEPPDGSKLTELYSPAQVGCAGAAGVCSLRRGQVLLPGKYTFRVFVETSGSAGPWWPQSFEVTGPSPVPPKPSLIAPSGTVRTPTPTLSWNAVSPATEYRLELTRPGSTTPLYGWLAAGDVGCGAGEATCSVVAPVVLGEGAHRFRVKGGNGGFRGPWSAALGFTVALRPTKPALLAPTGISTTRRPDFVWTPALDAESYRLYVKDARANVSRIDRSPADLGCDDGVSPCSLPFDGELPNGRTQVWVRGINAYGNGAWSDEVRFQVQAPIVLPGAVTLVAPLADGTSRRPDFVWTPGAAAASYVVRRVDPRGVVTALSISASAAGCAPPDATTCVLPTTTNLGFGTHRWQVRGRNASGNGPWSPEVGFRVLRPPAP